jgi:hypothetical protein
MTDQTIIKCEQCGQVYAARVTEKHFVLPTDDGCCSCGSDAFGDLTDSDGTGDGNGRLGDAAPP